jgi:hypothetical protein
MAGRVSMATRGELLAAIGDRYRASGRAERTKILDEFVAVTGRACAAPDSSALRRRDPGGVDRALGGFRSALLEAAEADHPGAGAGLGAARAARDQRDDSHFGAGDQPGDDRPLALRGSAGRARWSAPSSRLQLGSPAHGAGAHVGTIRRPASSRWILSRIRDHRRLAALCRQWC